MDLFAKDHPLEAAALRMQSAQPRLPGFVFESLPHTVRHRIYRELLLKPIDDYDLIEDPIGENRRSEHTKVGERFFDLTVLILKGANRMHPEIMRTNKKIHEEAAFVLYGENWFRWSLGGVEYTPMWQWREHESAVCPRHYSRLITKMSLTISNDGDGHDPTDAIWWTTQNLKHACKVLALNDFKILKVDFYNSAREMSEGERCLTPLKKCRAEKVSVGSVNGYAATPKLTSIAVPYQEYCCSTLCC